MCCKVSFRDAVTSDAEQLQQLNIIAQQVQGIYPRTKWHRPDINDIEAFYCNNGGFFLVAEKDDQIVGCCGVRMLSPTAGYVLRTRVHPDWQGQGIGTNLVEEVVSRARQDSRINWLLLDVHPKQEAAQKIYTKLGFSKIGMVYHGEEIMMECEVRS